MDKEEAFENLKEAWSEFCRAALADKRSPGVYRGQAISVLAIGDFLLEHIEDSVDLDEDEDDDGGDTDEDGESE